MKNLKGELVRVITADDLKLHGLLFEAENKTKTALVHIHAWIGNFYENEFLGHIAEEAVTNGIAFLTINNRGAGIVTDITRKRTSRQEYARIGGSLEHFEDSIYDIKAAIDYLASRGYENIILEGHSRGCQKAVYYIYKKKDKRVKALILLAPVDDVGYVRRLLGSRYKKSLDIANQMIKKGKPDAPVPGWMAFYPMLRAAVYLGISDPDSTSGRIFDYSGELEEIKEIECPSLAIFGSQDDYETNPEKKLGILKKTMKKCETKLIQNADHWFFANEDTLAESISQWFKPLIS